MLGLSKLSTANSQSNKGLSSDAFLIRRVHLLLVRTGFSSSPTKSAPGVLVIISSGLTSGAQPRILGSNTLIPSIFLEQPVMAKILTIKL